MFYSSLANQNAVPLWKLQKTTSDFKNKNMSFLRLRFTSFIVGYAFISIF